MARATQAVVKAVDTQTEDDMEAAIGEVLQQRCCMPQMPTPLTPE